MLLLLLFGLQAWAASPADVARARELSKEGADAFRAKDFETALARFREANRLVPHPNLDVNIGRCYEAMGQPDQGLVHCKIALNAPGVPEPTRQAAQQCVDRVTAALARPVLEITSAPPGALVLIDGRKVGKTPWRGTIAPGRRQIDLEHEGYEPLSQTLDAQPGKRYPLLLKLEKVAIGATLTLRSVPEGASVLLDGEVVGRTPLSGFAVEARSYVLELVDDGFERHVSRITIAEGQGLERSITLIPLSEKVEPTEMVRWPGWALVGLSVAAAGTGGAFGYWSLENNRKADDLARTSTSATDRASYEELDERWRSQATTADVLYLSAGVALAGGLTWLLWPESEDSR